MIDKQKVWNRLTAIGVVPVLRAENPENVMLAVEALMQGGIPVAEITLTVPGAIRVIEACARRFGESVVVGAGSVTDAAAAEEAIAAGAAFVVSPAFKREVVAACGQRGCPVVSGALTPTEILTAWEAGSDAVKVFPAKAMGGPAYIRMVREPLPHIPLVPTGGVDLETLPAYFKAGVAFVGAGGDLVGRKAIETGDTHAIRARAGQYIAAIRAARSA
jgi:2-dehydro-3-deoxyphosphogluconate aldolase / (4S)-4-hydroxy-2-oxoglutarate aldolase